jgi:hypothetical protein
MFEATMVSSFAWRVAWRVRANQTQRTLETKSTVSFDPGQFRSHQPGYRYYRYSIASIEFRACLNCAGQKEKRVKSAYLNA